MKEHPIVMGVDDGPFDFPAKVAGAKETVPVVGVTCKGQRLVGLDKTRVNIDGRDGTQQVIRLVRDSKHFTEIQYVLLDGVALGGFNLVECGEVSAQIGRPVIAVSVKEPDLPAMKAALQKVFPDARARIAILDTLTVPVKLQVNIGGEQTPIFYQAFGVATKFAGDLLRLLCLHSKTPEPIRLAHNIAKIVE